MFLPATAVKLRRCQCALLFCSPSHNGNQGFVRVERRVRGPQRAPKLRLLGWLSAASRALNIYCHPERGCVRHSERIRVEEPAPSEAEGTPIAARIPRFAIHRPLTTASRPPWARKMIAHGFNRGWREGRVESPGDDTRFCLGVCSADKIFGGSLAALPGHPPLRSG